MGALDGDMVHGDPAVKGDFRHAGRGTPGASGTARAHVLPVKVESIEATRILEHQVLPV